MGHYENTNTTTAVNTDGNIINGDGDGDDGKDDDEEDK